MPARKLTSRAQIKLNALGIDPGRKGWMTLVGPGGKILVAIALPWFDTEPDRAELLRILRHWHEIYGIDFAGVEHQQPFGRESAVSAFTAGRGYEAIISALVALDIPREEPRPVAWKEQLGLRKARAKTVVPKKPERASKAALKKWKKEKASAEAKRARERKADAKAVSMAFARRLAPRQDFRATVRSGDSGDFAESFLIAVWAQRRLTGGIDAG